MPNGLRPAEILVGLGLDGDWNVTSQVSRATGSSGGNFSVSYLVEHGPTSRQAFLKALDLTAMMSPGASVLDVLRDATNAYAHERDIVMQCAGHRLRNVVRALASGQVAVPVGALDPAYALFDMVPYIIFECGDADVRTAIAQMKVFDDAWALRMLHGAANGVRQLHSKNISHNDIKPSNVVAFDKVAKVGDLGRSSPAGGGGMFDSLPIAGDPAYSAPELLYTFLLPDERSRRRAADVYQLGSLIPFFFTGASLTALWSSRLDATFHWSTWPHAYPNALPYVRQAFDETFNAIAPDLPDSCRDELMVILRELCDPDPEVRGNPKAGKGSARYGLDRYVSIFDRLALSEERRLRRTGTP